MKNTLASLLKKSDERKPKINIETAFGGRRISDMTQHILLQCAFKDAEKTIEMLRLENAAKSKAIEGLYKILDDIYFIE